MRSIKFPRHALAARIAALALGLLAAPMAAQATLVSGSLSFTATGFSPAGAPIDPVTGTVSYSFDDSAAFFNAADGAFVNGVFVDVSVSAINLPGSWTPVLTYIKAIDVFAIGQGPTTVVTAGTDDWRFAVTNIANPVFREFVYASSGIPETAFLTTTGSVTAVPEPGTWALMLLGAAVTGVISRRSPQRSACCASSPFGAGARWWWRSCRWSSRRCCARR